MPMLPIILSTKFALKYFFQRNGTDERVNSFKFIAEDISHKIYDKKDGNNWDLAIPVDVFIKFLWLSCVGGNIE